MRILKKLLMFLVSSILSLFLILLIVGVSVDKLLYPQIYKEAFAQNGIYDLIEQNIIPQQIQGQIQMPEGAIEEQIDQLLDNFLAYLRYDSDVLDLTVHIKKETLDAIIEQKIKEMPECAHGQEPFVEEQIVCIPERVNITDVIDQVLESQNMSLDEVMQIDLTESVLDKEALEAIEQARGLVQIHKDVYLLSIFVSAILVFLSVILNLRNLREGFRWLGCNIFFTSISAFAIYMAVDSMKYKFINFGEEVVNNTVSYIFDSVLATFKYCSIVLLITGVFIAGLSFLFQKKDRMAVKKFHTLEVLNNHKEHIEKEHEDLEEESDKEVAANKKPKDAPKTSPQQDLNKTAQDK